MWNCRRLAMTSGTRPNWLSLPFTAHVLVLSPYWRKLHHWKFKICGWNSGDLSLLLTKHHCVIHCSKLSLELSKKQGCTSTNSSSAGQKNPKKPNLVVLGRLLSSCQLLYFWHSPSILQKLILFIQQHSRFFLSRVRLHVITVTVTTDESAAVETPHFLWV